MRTCRRFILERVPRQPLRVHGAVKRAGMEHRVTLHEIVARVMEASEDDSVVRINLVREYEKEQRLKLDKGLAR